MNKRRRNARTFPDDDDNKNLLLARVDTRLGTTVGFPHDENSREKLLGKWLCMETNSQRAFGHLFCLI